MSPRDKMILPVLQHEIFLPSTIMSTRWDHGNWIEQGEAEMNTADTFSSSCWSLHILMFIVISDGSCVFIMAAISSSQISEEVIINLITNNGSAQWNARNIVAAKIKVFAGEIVLWHKKGWV